jgi:hypothetical protein
MTALTASVNFTGEKTCSHLQPIWLIDLKQPSYNLSYYCVLLHGITEIETKIYTVFRENPIKIKGDSVTLSLILAPGGSTWLTPHSGRFTRRKSTIPIA